MELVLPCIMHILIFPSKSEAKSVHDAWQKAGITENKEGLSWWPMLTL